MHNGSANMITAFAYVLSVRRERKVKRRLLSSKLLIINYPRILLLAYESDFTSLKVSDTVCIKKLFIAVDISSNLCGISGVKVWDP